MRDAARWSTALVAESLCVATEGHKDVRPPDGLRCGGGLVSLPRPEVLGRDGGLGGSCEAILDALMERQREDRVRRALSKGEPVPPVGEGECRRLPTG